MTDKQLQTFQNMEFGEIRSMTINGEPWFVGKDIAAALGYSNPSKALIDHVDEEDSFWYKTKEIEHRKMISLIRMLDIEDEHYEFIHEMHIREAGG